jgi:hypothetical protein
MAASQAGATHAAPLNALQASIAARGATSYYFAHGNSSGGLRATLGDAPRLLASSTGAEAGAGAGAGARALRAVDSFSWADDGESVRVYVPYEGAAAALAEADVSLSAGERAFALEIRPPGAAFALSLKRGGLFADVTGGRVRRLKDRVLVILAKAEASMTWYELEEPARVGGTN